MPISVTWQLLISAMNGSAGTASCLGTSQQLRKWTRRALQLQMLINLLCAVPIFVLEIYALMLLVRTD